MEQLVELTEQLAGAVMGADAEDLPGLAAMHSQFQEIGRLGEGMSVEEEGKWAGALAAAKAAERLVEQLILRECDDAQAVLASLAVTVTELQRVAGEGGGMIAAPVVAAKASSGDEAPAAEPALNEEDLPLVREFIGESQAHIEAAETGMLQLESNPDDLDVVNTVFRAFHTIKGVAGFLNIRQIGALAHAAENLLDLARRGELRMSAGPVDLVLASIDLTKQLVGSLDEAIARSMAIPRNEQLPELLRRLHACAAGRGEVAEMATARRDDATAPPAGKDMETALAGGKDVEAAMKDGDGSAKGVEGASEAAASGKPASGPGGSTQESTVKVATDRLDSLINMVGEMVIAQAMVTQDMGEIARKNQRSARNLNHLGKITRELQELSMSMRMVPVAGVFHKMARLVRDLARKSGKQIEFVQSGGETEVDRNVVEAIGDPLVHMVRNAADHGIEPADERLAAGKPAVGRLELRAYHQGGNIVIEIKDDGRGLNKAKILKKAIAAGLVGEGETPSDSEIFKMIFLPGLSTAEKVTDVSGRGVGMDVVKRNVDSLRGRIDITSVEGAGSTFLIRLPLTLAVIDGLVVKVGGERYILPITSIERSLRPKPEQLSSVQGRGEMVSIRGKVLPLYRLHRLFNVTPDTEDPARSLVVIVQDNEKRCCLLVDALLGQQQVVIKSLGESMGGVEGVSGGAILGDGNVSMILDVPGILAMAERN